MRYLTPFFLGLSLLLSGHALAQDRVADDGRDAGLWPSEDQQKETQVRTEVSTDGENSTQAITMSTFEDLAMAAGCWATVYAERGFGGDSLTLIGPHDLTDLKFSPGKNWTGDIKSVEVGPGASLKLYGGKFFADLTHDLKAEMAIEQISTRPFWNSIESARLICTEDFAPEREPGETESGEEESGEEENSEDENSNQPAEQ